MDKASSHPNSKIAKFVRSARLALGKTQDQFADMYHCTKSNVSAWENGRHEPAFSILADMSKRSGQALPKAVFGSPDHDIPTRHDGVKIDGLPLSDDEVRFVRTYRKLSDEGKRLARMSVGMFVKLHPTKK